jgi:hypothetical protein
MSILEETYGYKIFTDGGRMAGALLKWIFNGSGEKFI